MRLLVSTHACLRRQTSCHATQGHCTYHFTIYQFFGKLREANQLKSDAPARNFGMALMALGITMLVFAKQFPLEIAYMVQLVSQSAGKSLRLLWQEVANCKKLSWDNFLQFATRENALENTTRRRTAWA